VPAKDRAAIDHPGKRALSTVRALYGLGLLIAPAGVLEQAARVPLNREALRVARVLGARQLVQCACVRHGSRPSLLVGAGIDGVHAASMLALSAVATRPPDRALARRNALTAAGLAVCGIAVARSDRPR
jgi:hypothetical protein